MAVNYRNVGIDRRDEVSPQRARHDLRRTGVKVAEALRTPVGGFATMLVLGVFSFMMPAVADLIFVVAMFLFLFIRNAHKNFTLAARIPLHSGMLDPLEVHPKTGKSMPAKGTFYIGNDRTSGEEVWLTNRDAGVHMLVLGTTGSGKTEMLLGLCQNALNQGSGFMFVDGKAQDKIAFKIQDLCRARGRDDDVLHLNFMTGARDIIGPQPSKITNTMNPFSYGSAGMISQIVVGLMASGGGGDDMWKDRAISFVEAISPPLTYLREHYGLILDVNEYRKYFELERIEELCWKGADKYPGLIQVLDPIRNYLINLPGYDEKKVGKKGQGEDTKLQHGYITMQLVRAFTSLADTYGHIVRVPLGEVYFPDVVRQRRILIAMLPSLEKTPSETANIGKIIVTALKNIMADGLGSILEGNRDELDNDEGRALLAPYLAIMDEYGYYAVKGFAVAFAQARSLGYVCVVGGQDLASFQRESKEEAVSICGNTRIKCFGSIEDPDQTMDFVVKTAGKAHVAETQGYEGDMGMMSMNYADQLSIHLKAVERIDPTDIKAQTEGQFTFVWRDRVIRAATYYVDPVRVKRVQLNHFVQVPPPDEAQLLEIEAVTTAIVDKLANADFRLLTVPSVGNIDSASAAILTLGSASVLEQGIGAIVAVGRERLNRLQDFRKSMRPGVANGSVAPERSAPSSQSTVKGSDDPDSFDADSFLNEVNPMPESEFQMLDTRAAHVDSSFGGAQSVVDDDIAPFEKMHVFLPKRRGFGDEVFANDDQVARGVQDAVTGQGDSAPMLNYNTTYKGVEQIERALGASREEADAVARDVVKVIEDRTRYPQSIPLKKTAEQVNVLFEEFLEKMS